jgi:uncharacterized membrane protein
MRRRRHPNERLLVLAALGVATAVCIAAELVRERHYGAVDFRFLLWNLFLAWIPLLVALAVYDLYGRGVRLALLAPAVALWLLFLPNAPYIVTDFVHLEAGAASPLWFDGLTLSAFAWTGMTLGFVSLYLMHAVVRDRLGARAGWVGATGALALASVGVFLGRFLQWNSWDMVVRPGQRLAEVAPKLDQTVALAHAAGIMLLLTGLLVTTYLAFYALAVSRGEIMRTWPAGGRSASRTRPARAASRSAEPSQTRSGSGTSTTR